MPTPTDDHILLAEYATSRSPEVLGQLVHRHIDFVYAAARRQLRDANLAEDVTQAVFIILAKKAGSIRSSSLVGWLFNTTRHCAKNARRAELRRHRYERLAAKREACMPADLTTIDQPTDVLHEMLDDGIASLGRRDREVVLMRYLQGREFSDLSVALGISEQAARKRLTRAITRLRRYFSDCGTPLAPALLISAMEKTMRQAPAHLSHTTVLSAAAGATAKTPGSLLAFKIIHLMSVTQMKFAAGIILAAVTTTAGIAVVVHRVLATAPASAQAATDPAVSPSAPGARDRGPFTAAFSDGMKVELLGLNNNPAGKNPWWQPDGSPLARAPYRQFGGNVSGDPGKPYEFGVRLTGAPPGSDSSLTTFGATSSWRIAPDITAYATLFLPNEPATIHLQFATQQWRKALSVPAKDVFTTGATVEGISFASDNDPKNPAGIIMVYTPAAAFLREEWLLVALDAKNVVHNITAMQSDNKLLVLTSHFKFGKLKREDVREYQIATRSYDRWVEFRNVSTQLGVFMDVQMQTSEETAKK